MSLRAPVPEWISQSPGCRAVLIHGMTMAPSFWHTFAPDLMKTGFSAAYPLPGHFPWVMNDEERLNISTQSILDAYAEAIERDFGGEPVVLLGHSTGAFVCLLLARHRPDLVSGVILVGGFACGRFEGKESLATRILLMPYFGPVIFMKLFLKWIATPENFRVGASRCVGDPGCPWETEATLARMEDVRGQLLLSNPLDIVAMAGWLRQQFLMEELPRISQPVLNIIGGQDRVVPAVHQLQVTRRLPNAKTAVFPKCGHLPMVEEAANFNRVVNDFVEMVTLRAPVPTKDFLKKFGEKLERRETQPFAPERLPPAVHMPPPESAGMAAQSA